MKSHVLDIITINFNDAKGLQKTISSVRTQTQKGFFRHIIIDGGSTDGSISIIKDYSEEFENVVWVSEPDSGIYDAMNKGFIYSDGKFVAFLNSGDILYNDFFLERYVEFLIRNTDADFIYNDLQLFRHQGLTRYWRAGTFKPWKLYLGWMPPHPMTAVSGTLVETMPQFDTNLTIAADYDFMLVRLLDRNIKVKYTGLYAVKMEAGGISNGSLLGILRSNIQVLRSWRKHCCWGVPPIWIIVTKPLLKIFQFFR